MYNWLITAKKFLFALLWLLVIGGAEIALSDAEFWETWQHVWYSGIAFAALTALVNWWKNRQPAT